MCSPVWDWDTVLDGGCRQNLHTAFSAVEHIILTRPWSSVHLLQDWYFLTFELNQKTFQKDFLNLFLEMEEERERNIDV